MGDALSVPFIVSCCYLFLFSYLFLVLCINLGLIYRIKCSVALNFTNYY